MNEIDETKELIKKNLIVGETLNQVHSYQEYQPYNMISATVLLAGSVYSMFQAISDGSFWFMLSIFFLVASLYYGVNFKISIIHAITKFRIIQIKREFSSKFFYRSSLLVGYNDLHYEHVESITVQPPMVEMPKLYLSIFLISTGWLFYTRIESYSSIIRDFVQLISFLLIITSVIYFAFHLPTGGVRLVITSTSGERMKFPERKIPSDFIDNLILNCRAFLSYEVK